MANDPAFLFYPGDYLRDTQILSEKSQVAYDRLMCEHMRNICISKQQLKFITKRLNEDEKEELMSVLNQNESGFFISWVVESINKRRNYSESRRNNRKKKNEKDMLNISESYVEHMENENENENINIKEGAGRKKKVVTEKIDYPPEFEIIISEWLTYKKEIGKPYKGQTSIKVFVKHLLELSNKDPVKAKKIIEQSIANNWSGIFELKTQKNNRAEIEPKYERIHSR